MAGVLGRMFKRRPPVPEPARRHLARDEQALAWAQAVTGQVLVATSRGLHIVGEQDHRLIGWHEISKATWGERKLTVIESRAVDGMQIVDVRPWRLEFDEPGGIPVILRQRVESSVVFSVHRQLAGGVRIVGRKITGRDGLIWQYRLDKPRELPPMERAELERAVEEQRIAHTPADL